MSGSAAPERVPSAFDIDRARPRGWHIPFHVPGYGVRDLLPFRATLDHGYMDELLDLLAEGALDEVARRTIPVDNSARLFEFA